MDEAGHAVEAEMIVPIIGLMSTPNGGHKNNSKPSEWKGSLILAGDPKQLGPVIQSKLALHIGLGEYSRESEFNLMRQKKKFYLNEF